MRKKILYFFIALFVFGIIFEIILGQVYPERQGMPSTKFDNFIFFFPFAWVVIMLMSIIINFLKTKLTYKENPGLFIALSVLVIAGVVLLIGLILVFLTGHLGIYKGTN
jgi:hypothetical protein